jgi:hypothetical protein
LPGSQKRVKRFPSWNSSDARAHGRCYNNAHCHCLRLSAFGFWSCLLRANHINVFLVPGVQAGILSCIVHRLDKDFRSQWPRSKIDHFTQLNASGGGKYCRFRWPKKGKRTPQSHSSRRPNAGPPPSWVKKIPNFTPRKFGLKTIFELREKFYSKAGPS